MKNNLLFRRYVNPKLKRVRYSEGQLVQNEKKYIKKYENENVSLFQRFVIPKMSYSGGFLLIGNEKLFFIFFPKIR